MPMLLTNLNDLNDVRQSHALLSQRLIDLDLPTARETPETPETPETTETRPAERFMAALWPRLSQPLRVILKASEQFGGEFNIAQLATVLNRPYPSVKASLNGPLARAIATVRKQVPDGPHHVWSWRRCDDGHFEATLPVEIRPILATLAVTDPR